jgi:hypothetical protein
LELIEHFAEEREFDCPKAEFVGPTDAAAATAMQNTNRPSFLMD